MVILNVLSHLNPEPMNPPYLSSNKPEKKRMVGVIILPQ